MRAFEKTTVIIDIRSVALKIQSNKQNHIMFIDLGLRNKTRKCSYISV